MIESNKNSLLYWYPLIEGSVPTPHTVIVEIPNEVVMEFLNGKNGLEEYRDRIFEAADGIGYPLFLRTDQSSSKHQWKDTCYVDRKESLMDHIYKLCEGDAMADIMGLPTQALVFREFLHLKTAFTAFNGMPIAREFRCFADTGKMLCIHPYWPEEAIEFYWNSREEYQKALKAKDIAEDDFEARAEIYANPPHLEDWKPKLKKISRYSELEEKLLTAVAEKVTRLVTGAWSVDICQTEDNCWYLTDMALASQSYHYPHEKGD